MLKDNSNLPEVKKGSQRDRSYCQCLDKSVHFSTLLKSRLLVPQSIFSTYKAVYYKYQKTTVLPREFPILQENFINSR